MNSQVLNNANNLPTARKNLTLYKQGAVFIDMAVFLVGLLSAYYLTIVGQLYLAEIFLPLFIPLFWRSKSYLLRNKETKWIFMTGGIWLLGQIVTDLIRSTTMTDLLRGWALIAVFLFDFLALYLLLYPNPRRILISLSGFAVGGFLQPLLQPDRYFPVNSWKFGFGQPLTLLLLILGCLWAGKNLRRNAFLAIPVAALGLYSLYADSRSLGGIILLAAIILLLRSTLLGRILVGKLKFANLIAMGLLLFGLAWSILSTYTLAARNGWFGNIARVNYQLQGENEFEILVNGRIELFPALRAIFDSPIIGHGSWGRDPQYRNYLYDLIQLGYISPNETARIDFLVSSSDIIPTHSHVLQAWVWGGFFGALFWISVLVLILRALLATSKSLNSLHGLIIYTGILSIWNVLFSPFGSQMRLQWAFFLVLFLYAATINRTVFSAKIRS